MADITFGHAISVTQANRNIKMYTDVNEKASIVINEALEKLTDGSNAKKFFGAIQLNNAFVFDAELIQRFFTEGKPVPKYFVVCLGGAIEEGNEGDATVIVTGCTRKGKDFHIVGGVENPVSEHPAKTAIAHFDEEKEGEEKLYFTIQ